MRDKEEEQVEQCGGPWGALVGAVALLMSALIYIWNGQ